MHPKSTILKERIKAANELFSSCALCGHRCGVDRTSGETGKCGAGKDLVVASHTVHHGEEPYISGFQGSGTIFFSFCSLYCPFCQNHEISHGHKGETVSPEKLSDMMLELQWKGVHNINLVTPTHFIPAIMQALQIAYENKLDIPLVYNTNGYDSMELLKLLDGVIDIYMPDLKYAGKAAAAKYSNAANYPEVAMEGIREMHRQVGDLKLDEDDIACRGLLVRHLVLPGNVEDSKNVIGFLSGISKDLVVSIMSQYSPQYKACEHPEINRTLTKEEYWKVIEKVQEAGLQDYLIQEMDSSEVFIPDFGKKEPFEL